MEQTSTGLTLMVIGLFLEWIPYVDFIGLILMIIGTIYMILGRHGFGDKHAQSVGIAVAIYIIMGVVVGVTVISFVFTIIANHSNTAAISGIFNNYIVALLVEGAILSTSYVILIYSISESEGRMFLIIAFVAQIVISGLMFIVTKNAVNSLLSNSNNFVSGEAGVLSGLDKYTLFSAIPLLLYAYAYYLARERVDTEISKLD
jgi:hypothetical protein